MAYSEELIFTEGERKTVLYKPISTELLTNATHRRQLIISNWDKLYGRKRFLEKNNFASTKLLDACNLCAHIHDNPNLAKRFGAFCAIAAAVNEEGDAGIHAREMLKPMTHAHGVIDCEKVVNRVGSVFEFIRWIAINVVLPIVVMTDDNHDEEGLIDRYYRKRSFCYWLYDARKEFQTTAFQSALQEAMQSWSAHTRFRDSWGKLQGDLLSTRHLVTLNK